VGVDCRGAADGSPVDTVREDPVRKGLLFAGTETEVRVSFDDGNHWQALQFNLPRTSMRDLAINGNDLIVATHGRSFWILDDISPLRQLSAVKADGGPFLFKPGAAYRVRRSTYPDTPVPPDEPMGENPPDGAVIDYSLPADASGPVTLEILDSGGKQVRKYASTDAPESDDGRAVEAADSALLAAHAEDAAGHAGYASLGVGHPVHHADSNAVWIPNLRSAARHAARARGAARAARDVYGSADRGRQGADRSADDQDRSKGPCNFSGAGDDVCGAEQAGRHGDEGLIRVAAGTFGARNSWRPWKRQPSRRSRKPLKKSTRNWANC